MPPLPPTFDDSTNATIASIQRRQTDLQDFQIPRLRGCTESLAIQQQYSAELREDLDALTRLVEALDESVDVQRSERDRKDLRGTVESFRADISRLRKDMRAALLASKRAIDAKASSNREELLRSSVLKEKKTSEGQTAEDTVMKVQADVTDALRRTMTLMQGELERSVLSTQMLEASTASLKGTSSTQELLTDLLGASKQLVTVLEKSDWLDRILIFTALAFFVLVVLFILKQRIIDRGLRIAFWWTRFLPYMSGSSSQYNDAAGDMMERGSALAQSTASIVSFAAAVTAATAALPPTVSGVRPDNETPLARTADVVADLLSDASTTLHTSDTDFLTTTVASLASETPYGDSVHDEL
ncbi:Sec20-domain-containing protein [Gloeopeniophorella convolvens]|nr:Sec20-domain-containing protein [Gloeopeniophorella convolvens]